MKKYIGIAITLAVLVLSTIGCASTTTVTTTEQTTIPASTKTVTVTSTNNLTTTANNTITATSTSTVTAITTNVMTTTATTSVTTTATRTVTATVTNTVTTTVVTSKLPTTTTGTHVTTAIGTTVSAPVWVRETVPGAYEVEETHTMSVTVLEVIRGNQAWDMVKAADASNKAPDTGYEYLLAKVKFVYGSGGTLPYTLKKEYFKAYSSESTGYTTPSIVSPEPVFIGTMLYPGQIAEGWIPYIVSKTDNKPTMFYTGSTSWFQLY